VQATRPLVRQLVEKLRKQGLSEEKIKRLVEAEVLRLFLRQAFREIILLLFTL
jgi:broad-specificity NMP kinase